MNKLVHSSRRGQSLVEFALIIPAFILIVVVVFDLGRAVYYSSSLHNAAREAARYGIVHPENETNIKQKAVDYAIGLGINIGNIQGCIENYDPDNINSIQSYPPPRIKVFVTYNFFPVTPLVSQFLPTGSIQLTGEAIMKLEVLPKSVFCDY